MAASVEQTEFAAACTKCQFLNTQFALPTPPISSHPNEITDIIQCVHWKTEARWHH